MRTSDPESYSEDPEPFERTQAPGIYEDPGFY